MALRKDENKISCPDTHSLKVLNKIDNIVANDGDILAARSPYEKHPT